MNKEYRDFLHQLLGVDTVHVEDLEKNYPQFPLIHISKGKVLFTQGEKAGSLYIIIKGRATVLNTIDWSINNIVDIIERPHIIGLMEVMNHSSRVSSYVVAISDMVLYHINGNDFLQIIKHDSILCFDTLMVMSVVTENTMLSAEIKKTFPAQDVLGFYLFQFGKNHLNEELKISRAELAEELHINLRTLFRYLEDFKKNGYIKNKQRKIVIGEKELKKLSDRYANIQL